eukprot:TRINITY_DN8106_c0_g1_i1.p1 TRINITY_DN8106_c0_g1~~TRINITY_DN8106_c0_g1_i1.p1  ORF type:complete len:754 (-),score=168.75 TRINITY_DN8106_c0_g1_i1:16-2277(-)
MDYIYDAEDRDNIRFSWNIFPSTKVEAKKLVVPLGCIYSPMKVGVDTVRVEYNPLGCGNCNAILNPYCATDLENVPKTWSCSLCGARNQFPETYAGISPEALPSELHATGTTIEYLLPNQNLPPAFLFAVDITLAEKEFQVLKNSLIEILESLPENIYVGLMTVGSTVQLYDLAFNFFPKSYMFDGTKDADPNKISKVLGIGIVSGNTIQGTPVNRFIMPLHNSKENLINIINTLKQDPVVTPTTHRPALSTGVAISVGISVLQYTFPNSGAKLITLLGGPCTQGPGLIVGAEKTEPIRGYYELNKETASHTHQATKFYESLAERAVIHGICVDLFLSSLDQTGALEMKQLCKTTGGQLVNSEGFGTDDNVFEHSFRKFFEINEEGVLNFGFLGTIEVLVSEEIGIAGAVGNLSSLNKGGKSVSSNELGIGHTTAWRMACTDPKASYAIFFDIKNPKDKIIPQGKLAMIQFRSTYSDSAGRKFLKITTVAHSYVDVELSGPPSLLPGFDQECAAALVARLIVHKADVEETDMLGWLDRHLIQFTKRYASFIPGDIHSFEMRDEIRLYPQFMFHLRRGPIVSNFGNSPDDTTFIRYCLNREITGNCLTMIQPSLEAYHFDSEEPEVVLLSSSSIKPDVILLLDTYFHIVVFHGSKIAKWRKANYQEKEEYESFRELLEAPKIDASYILEDRFPYPLFVDCDEGGSQARYLTAVVDPEPSSQGQFGVSGKVHFHSEDASLQRFMEHLKKFVTQQN